MERIKLRYYGKHMPPGIYEIRKDKADELVKNDDYDFVDKPIKTEDSVPKSKEHPNKTFRKHPNKSWTEKKIKEWIVKNNIPVDYNISKDYKADILMRLRQGGYLDD